MEKRGLSLVNGLERTTVGTDTVVTGDRRTHLRLSPSDLAVLDVLDGTLSRREVIDRFGSDAQDLLGDLESAGLFPDSSLPTYPGITVSASGIEFDGFDRLVACVYRRLPALVWSRWSAVAAGVLVMGGLIAVFSPPQVEGSAFSATAYLAALLVVAWVATFVHETAHALLIHRYGRRVGRAGLGFYWGDVAYFVDATDALFLPRRQRLLQALAGPATDAIIAAVLSISAHLVSDGAWSLLLYRAALGAWIVALINGSPVLKLDGYWIVTDLLDTPDLHARARSAVGGFLRGARDRRTVLLVVFAAGSSTSGVLLLVSSIFVWANHYLPLIVGAAGSDPIGWAVAVAFAAPTVGGLLAGVVHLTRRLTLCRVRKPHTLRKEVN